MDINVEKFVRDYGRMCDTYYPNGCYNCPIDRNEKAHDRCNHIENLEIIAPVVQKWVEEHPIRTYLMDFKEKFPNMDINLSFYSYYCVKKFYGADKKPESCIYTDCSNCWNREMV